MFHGKIKCIHFIGVGGSGMSGIAEVLITMGYTVSGSDTKHSPTIDRLRNLGGNIHIGHDPKHICGVDVVVKSTAVPNSNVEIIAAQSANIPVIPRAEMLAELMRVKYGIAVAGTHGKTTTTSMIATCLQGAGLDPTVVIGGRLNSLGSSAREGKGAFMVAEADESDGSFMMLAPTIAVITSIDPEHMTHWLSEKALVDGFFEFANKVPFFGFTALCIDHPTVRTIMPWLRRRVISYGLSVDAMIRGEDLVFDGPTTAFTVYRNDERMGRISLGMPGDHNVCNALAATAICLELDVSFQQIQAALNGFSGIDRRFSIRCEINSDDANPITIIDDYAHHPMEIRATLTAVRRSWPNRRIISVFQPHRYSRVANLLADFCESFSDSDHTVVCPVYAAGETPIPRIDNTRILEEMKTRANTNVVRADSLEEVMAHLVDHTKPGDVIITLGAGDVNRICVPLGERLANGPR